MGKRLIQQRRGKGSSTFRRPGHKFLGKIKHLRQNTPGKIVDFRRDSIRGAPVAIVEYAKGDRQIFLPCEGHKIGDIVMSGSEAELKEGNTLPLAKIPDGTPIYNVESRPGDGGKFARGSGVYAYLISHDQNNVRVRLPSKQIKRFHPNCQATIGVVAGAGRTEKPIVKAGNAKNMARAKNKYYPTVSGIAMNCTDHPFGGGNHPHPGKPKTVSRHAPRGRKVGSIAARRTGKKR